MGKHNTVEVPIIYQRIEAAALLVASVYFYHHFGFSLLFFGLLLFAFDIFMVGYLINKRVGAHVYNLGHSLIGPAALLAAASYLNNWLGIAVSIIWVAHIGMDRALGYGLKTCAGFRHTHLGDIGK